VLKRDVDGIFAVHTPYHICKTCAEARCGCYQVARSGTRQTSIECPMRTNTQNNVAALSGRNAYMSAAACVRRSLKLLASARARRYAHARPHMEVHADVRRHV